MSMPRLRRSISEALNKSVHDLSAHAESGAGPDSASPRRAHGTKTRSTCGEPSVARNSRIEVTRKSALAIALTCAALMVSLGAQATQADRDQPVNVNADSFQGSQDAGKATLNGNVKIDQGTLHADGGNAVATFNKDNQVQRVVLTGKPAHMQQKLDDGSMVHGSADTIDYTVSENTVVLTGNATVVQQDRGEFHGAKLVYNTDSGQINGEGGAGGQVHMVLQPKTSTGKPARKPAAPSTPAPASSKN